MKYTTCVSIAERTPLMMRRRLDSALKRSKYAELRLDALKPSQVAAALDLVSSSLRHVICTIRPRSEGGMFSGTEEERVSLLLDAARRRPFLVDMEYDTLAADPSLVRQASSSGARILVSWHDFAGTPQPRTLARRFERMSQISDHVKVVTTASSIDDASRVLSLYSHVCRTRLVAFAMGDAGRISRILCLYMGSPFTYVSLGRPVAPGQFSLDQMMRLSGLAG